jgi:hypothetical protein
MGAPVQIRHDIGSEDGNAARLLARKLNMQRRQLSTVEKHEVIRQQLRETWFRSDRWIGEDLGVSKNTVEARRRELMRDGQFDHLPEEVKYRNGNKGPYKVPQRQAKSKPKKSKPDQAPEETPEPTQTTIDEQIESAKAEQGTADTVAASVQSGYTPLRAQPHNTCQY